MSIYRPSRNVYIVAIPAVGISALATIQGVSLYVSHNAAECGGGLGWIGPGLLLFATLAFALLITLIAYILALISAFRGRRWAWLAGLIAAATVGTLVTIFAYTPFSRMVVGYALGFGCSWFYGDAARSLVPFLVAAPTLAFFLIAHRRA
jgi:hypothetical protein